MDRIHDAMTGADALVLNGDIFDFPWTKLPDIDMAVDAAMNWLADLVRRFPESALHMVAGNHDCHQRYLDRLLPWVEATPNVHFHEYVLRLDNCLFLHGDAANYTMSAEHLARLRRAALREARKPDYALKMLALSHRLGLVMAAHRLAFPRRRTVKRLLHFLRDYDPAALEGVDHVYFGHTHLPFSGFSHEGLTFHNTGSGIVGMDFNMLAFTCNDADPVPLRTFRPAPDLG